MAAPLTVNQNPYLQNTVFGSKWFNPDYLFNRAVDFFNNLFSVHINNNWSQIAAIYHDILFGFTVFFLVIIFYCAIRMLEIRHKEHKHLHHEIVEYAHHQAERAQKAQEGDGVSKNERWLKTLNYTFSQHPSDWKLAIIEGDAMLEALLNQLGFSGATLGDKLKGATQEKFHSLSAAWEAHTVRNRIAHEGASFELSQREAKRVIALYESIFREFGFI